MHGFDRRHDAANKIKKASLFGNATEHPGVAMAGKDMLKDRVAPVRDGAHFDDVAQPLRAVVTSKFSERSFDFFHIEKHMPFDHHLSVGRYHEVFAEGFRRRETKRRAHDGADLGVVVDAECRDIERTQIKCRMMANDDSHRRRPVPLFILTVDLPVVSRRHVQAKLPWTFHHVALEGDIVKAFIRVLHHRGHVDVWCRVHRVMADHRQLENVRVIAALDDLFDRRFARGNRYRINHRILAPGILQAQR